MEKILKEFNLTNSEIKIYLTLLKSGSTLAGGITTKTGLHRRNVYDSIERLIKKGLVGYIIKDNKKYFKATDPEHFLHLLEEEQEALKQKEEDLREILPKLLVLKKLTKNNQRVTIFEGKKGLITILEDVIKMGGQNLVLSTTKIHLIKDYLKWFHKKRVKAKVVDKLILNKKDINRAKQLAKLPYTQVRIMSKEFDSPLALNIYADKVGILILSENPIAILIEDKEVYESFKKYFKLLWDMAQRV